MTTRKKHDNKIRSKIINLHREGKPWLEFSKNCDVPYSTAYSWILSDRELPLRRGGTNRTKKTPEISEFMINFFDTNIRGTLKKCQEAIEAEFGVTVCTTTINNWLDCEFFTLKDARHVSVGVNTLENKILRKEYLEKMINDRSNGRNKLQPVFISQRRSIENRQSS